MCPCKIGQHSGKKQNITNRKCVNVCENKRRMTMAEKNPRRTETTDALFDAILSLETREECYNFFEDLCTVKEISDMAQRLEAAKMLLDGSTYEQIVKAVEISTATISRINRCIQYGSGGYRDTIEKVRAKQQ